YGHKLLMSGATLFANVFLFWKLVRRRKENVSMAKSKKTQQERGFIIISVVSYLFYMAYFINGFLSRDFHIRLAGYSQYILLGFSSHSPFWCMMLFASSLRSVIMRRKPTMALAAT
ncbi:hypothetical protein PENTCL1PPCAC_28421, partial [Pristionchus entomophagus]